MLYLGISNTPAWIVTAANTYAKGQGKTQFSVSSGQWSVLVRDLEREIIPMARGFDMAISPGEVLGAGKFQIPEEVEQRKKAGKTFRPFGGGGQVRDERGLGASCCRARDQVGRGHRNRFCSAESSAPWRAQRGSGYRRTEHRAIEGQDRGVGHLAHRGPSKSRISRSPNLASAIRAATSGTISTWAFAVSVMPSNRVSTFPQVTAK